MKNVADQRKMNALAIKKDGVAVPVADTTHVMPNDYTLFLQDLKIRIRQERIKTVLSANSALVLMYWDIGFSILERQKNADWGARIIDRMAYDLKEEFPDMRGFSARNLIYMRNFAEKWPNKELVQRTVALIPWRSNLILLEKVKDTSTRLWYAEKTIEYGWSRDVLAFQIKTRLDKRIGQTANNFDVALPPPDSDMANQIFKNPYIRRK